MKDDQSQSGPAPSPALGHFSISLSVKDLSASIEFYEKLGFRVFGGNAAQGWLIMQSGSTTIGLFQGMFPKNTLTFNPGWDASAKTLPAFDDVREIQTVLMSRGLQFDLRADPDSAGPAHIALTDPDGNPILIDQHVDRPVR
ncbi:MAG: VOC family protein [Phycisphaerae bacterium]|nr:VOC family protein [Phycisphaerae bacterium]